MGSLSGYATDESREGRYGNDPSQETCLMDTQTCGEQALGNLSDMIPIRYYDSMHNSMHNFDMHLYAIDVS